MEKYSHKLQKKVKTKNMYKQIEPNRKFYVSVKQQNK